MHKYSAMHVVREYASGAHIAVLGAVMLPPPPAPQGEVVNEVDCGDWVNCLRISPDSTRIAAALDNSTSVVVPLLEPRIALRLTGHRESRLLGVDWSPDGLLIASCGVDRQVCIFSAESGTRMPGPIWVALTAGMLCVLCL